MPLRMPLREVLGALSLLLVFASCHTPDASDAPRETQPAITASELEEPEEPVEPVEPVEPTEQDAPAETRPALRMGVDVSNFNGEISWSHVIASGHDFAIVKATEGVDFEDPSFAQHWKELGDLEIVRGAYHFYVTEDDPEDQARFFLSTVEWAQGDLVPIVDIELIGHATHPGLAGRLATWLEMVEKAVGAKPIIYTSPNFWNEHLDDHFGNYPLWVSEYGVDQPRLPAGWKTWALWQWKDDGTVPGILKAVDINRFNDLFPDRASLLLPKPFVGLGPGPAPNP